MRITHEMIGIVAAAALVSGVHWLADGRPSGIPSEVVAETPLEEGEIDISTLLSEALDGVLFIDARRPDEWQKDGVRGSINITTLSDQMVADQMAPHFEALVSARRIVVYCGDIHCGLSHELAEQLREYPDMLGGQLAVLHGGMTALRDAGLVTETSSGS